MQHIWFLLIGLLLTQAQAGELQGFRFGPEGRAGMVVADDGIAASWGAEVLKKGGNAVDAAVATALAMSVTRPQHSSLGGGGFMILCPPPTGGKAACQALDYREVAPQAATRDMYLVNGKPTTDLSQDGAKASGVPGVVAGLFAAQKKYGKLRWAQLFEKPIQLARGGTRVATITQRAIVERWDALNPEARKILGCGTAKACEVSEKLVQPDLAQVLEAVRTKGVEGFYQGPVAEKLVSGLQSAGGILTKEDLKRYAPKWREPVRGKVWGHEIVSMPPPSSGGAILIQLLSYQERADRAGTLNEGWGSVPAIHAAVHAMSLAFADRTEHFGDPDAYLVPLAGLLDPAYLDARWKSFKPGQAELPTGPGKPAAKEGAHTTHLSAIDRDGFAVALTTTINDNLGSGFVPPGTGVVMNNEMDDFSIAPGVPNLFGLVGGEANAVGPGKKPLSSMSPTVVLDEQGHARLAVGAAGGPRIITAVFHTLLNRLKFGMKLPDAVAAARFHHQWKPDTVLLETPGWGPDTREKLKKLGYKLQDSGGLAKVHALERTPEGRVIGAADPRAEGAAVAQ